MRYTHQIYKYFGLPLRLYHYQLYLSYDKPTDVAFRIPYKKIFHLRCDLHVESPLKPNMSPEEAPDNSGQNVER